MTVWEVSPIPSADSPIVILLEILLIKNITQKRRFFYENQRVQFTYIFSSGHVYLAMAGILIGKIRYHSLFRGPAAHSNDHLSPLSITVSKVNDLVK